MFRCIRCGEALPSDANLFGVRCDNCGGKIFTKEHPNVKKVLKARSATDGTSSHQRVARAAAHRFHDPSVLAGKVAQIRACGQ